MRIFIVVLMFLPLTGFASEYPKFGNEKLNAIVGKYKQDSILVKSPHFFDDTKALSAWPCTVPEVELYRLAGLQGAHPQLKLEYDKGLRKALRAGGMGPGKPNETFSNIKFFPLKVTCVDGKPDGELQYLTFYDYSSETSQALPNGNDISQVVHKTTNRAAARSHLIFKNGTIEFGDDNVTYSKMNSMTEMHSENADLDKSFKKSKVAPIELVSITYQTKEKVIAIFVVNSSIESFMIMDPIDAERVKTTTYVNKVLTSIMHMKNGRAHGENIMYQDNYLKPLKLKLEDVAHVGDASLEMVDGVEKIVTRTCWRNGEQFKMSPCTNE